MSSADVVIIRETKEPPSVRGGGGEVRVSKSGREFTDMHESLVVRRLLLSREGI